MKILGLDSSGMVAGVAIVEDDILVAEYTTNYKKTHSQTLLPMLDEVKTMIELDLDSIDAIAVAAGPGSFTGLRIGSATAKGLGLALKKPLVEVPTLEGLAYNLWGADGLICPLIDARRSQVYTGIYEFLYEDVKRGSSGCARHARLSVVQAQDALEIGELIERLNTLAADRQSRRVIFVGDGVPVYEERLREGMKVPYCLAPASDNRQRAASVAALGAEYFAAGRTVSAAEHQPEYLRKSQAERERQERGE